MSNPDERLLEDISTWGDAVEGEVPLSSRGGRRRRRIVWDEDEEEQEKANEGGGPRTRWEYIEAAAATARYIDESRPAIEITSASSSTPKRPNEDELESGKRRGEVERDAPRRGKRSFDDEEGGRKKPSAVAVPDSPRGFSRTAADHLRSMRDRERDREPTRPRGLGIPDDEEMATSVLASGSEEANAVVRSFERDISIDTANPDHWDLGVSSPFLRDEQKWLDFITDTGEVDPLEGRLIASRIRKLKFNIAAKNVIYHYGEVAGVTWRGTCTNGEEEKTFVAMHIRKTFPNSTVLWIQNTYRRVLEHKLW